MQHIIIGNFGNHSLAVLQELINRKTKDLYFIYVKTGWESPNWPERIAAVEAYALKHSVKVLQLPAIESFSGMVKDRKQFPSQKFQWCAGFLKGMTIIDELDKLDPFCESIIISGKRRLDSIRYQNLPEFDEDNEYYQSRTVWHPLFDCSDNRFQNLIEQTGFDFLNHPSQECFPCIHFSESQICQLDILSKERLAELESTVKTSMFEHPISQYQTRKKEKDSSTSSSTLKQFDLGCGSPWCCGE